MSKYTESSGQYWTWTDVLDSRIGGAWPTEALAEMDCRREAADPVTRRRFPGPYHLVKVHADGTRQRIRDLPQLTTPNVSED